MSVANTVARSADLLGVASLFVLCARTKLMSVIPNGDAAAKAQMMRHISIHAVVALLLASVFRYMAIFFPEHSNLDQIVFSFRKGQEAGARGPQGLFGEFSVILTLLTRNITIFNFAMKVLLICIPAAVISQMVSYLRHLTNPLGHHYKFFSSSLVASVTIGYSYVYFSNNYDLMGLPAIIMTFKYASYYLEVFAFIMQLYHYVAGCKMFDEADILVESHLFLQFLSKTCLVIGWHLKGHLFDFSKGIGFANKLLNMEPFMLTIRATALFKVFLGIVFLVMFVRARGKHGLGALGVVFAIIATIVTVVPQFDLGMHILYEYMTVFCLMAGLFSLIFSGIRGLAMMGFVGMGIYYANQSLLKGLEGM
eukprot:TRINITY_DN2722_c0_g1_i1.p1 TRINITY_DN2722_c0_g1~~TRINITY_DN2722_c0_g1_i1.p1  ORF type:complete len:366 (+),score=70.94 TRINITY_DN2722_c0_g1_i1:114-1211(+)